MTALCFDRKQSINWSAGNVNVLFVRHKSPANNMTPVDFQNYKKILFQPTHLLDNSCAISNDPLAVTSYTNGAISHNEY